MEINADIYAALEALSEPALLPEPWCDRPAPSGYRRLRDSRAAAGFLRQKFSDAELLAAGVFLRADQAPAQLVPPRKKTSSAAKPKVAVPPSGPSGLNPYLRIGGWLVLRSAAGEPPFDIVTAGGCLSGQLPVLAALQDATIKGLLKEFGDTLYAPFRLADAAVLLSLEYPAIPATGLEKLHGQALEKFCRRFDVRSLHGQLQLKDDDEQEQEQEQVPSTAKGNPPQSSSPPPVSPPPVGSSASGPAPDQEAGKPQAAPEPKKPSQQYPVYETTSFSLCFVAWHPAELSFAIPQKLARVRAHLDAVATDLDLLMDQLFVWLPAPDLEAKLRHVLAYGVPSHLERFVHESESTSVRMLFSPAAEAAEEPKPPLTIHAAFDALFDAGAEFRGHRLQEFCQVVNQQAIGPLLATADADTDPVSKVRIIGQAAFLRQQLSQIARQVQSGSAWRPGQTMDDGPLRPSEVEQLDNLAKSLLNLRKVTEPPRGKG